MAKAKDLSAKLARIDELLASVDPATAKSLRRGASPTKLAKLAKLLPIGDDLAAFFRWHDGQTQPSQLPAGDNRTPLSIDEAIDAWTFLGDPSEDARQPWSKAWLPLMTNGAGDYLCIDTGAQGRGRLVAYFHDDDRRPIQFSNLAAWADDVATHLAKQKPPKPRGKRLVIDGVGAKWKRRTKPPTRKEVEGMPTGTALSWDTVMPVLRGAETRTHVFVKVEVGAERPWRTATGRDAPSAIALIQGYSDQKKQPDDSFWKADDFSVAFNAKETNHDDTVDDPVPVTVKQATVAVRFE